MKIAMVTVMTPWKENFKGTSALPYHLLIHRPEGVEVEIWSFNNNELPQEKIRITVLELGVKMHVIARTYWWNMLFRWHLLFLRVFFPKPIHSYLHADRDALITIRAFAPDRVWVYGEELIEVDRQLQDYPRMHTFPDSEGLYYYRMLGRRFVADHWKAYLRCVVMYRKFRRLERGFPTTGIWYHLVGDADAAFLREESPGIDARFLRHPHYEIVPQEERHFHTPIRLLIAGQYNYYMRESADALIPALASAADLSAHFELTFLGRGWERHAEVLRAAGWKVTVITFAPDYVAEVQRHDIQLTPIAIGTGTKGKVLDAMANGLLVIGTPFALENIAVEHGCSCLSFSTEAEAVGMLRDVPADVARYEQMAEEGRRQVLKEHSRRAVAKCLFR